MEPSDPQHKPVPPPPFPWPNSEQAGLNHEYYNSLLTPAQREERQRQLIDLVNELSGRVPFASNAGATPVWDPYKYGRRAVDAMKQAGGEPLSREDAAARLGISLASLYDRIKDREIVVWTDLTGCYQFPAWQFGVNGLLPGLVDCLKLLGMDDCWAVMKFFLAPSEMAGDVAPVELLRNNRVDEAKAVASAVGFHS